MAGKGAYQATNTAPTITFSSPASVTGTSTWDSSTRVLKVYVCNGGTRCEVSSPAYIAEDTAVVFTIDNVRTPSSVFGATGGIRHRRRPVVEQLDADWSVFFAEFRHLGSPMAELEAGGIHHFGE